MDDQKYIELTYDLIEGRCAPELRLYVKPVMTIDVGGNKGTLITYGIVKKIEDNSDWIVWNKKLPKP